MIDPGRLASHGVCRVFVRDMVLPASIGVYPHEQRAQQRVRVNVDLAVHEEPASGAGLTRAGVGRDDLRRVLNYEAVVGSIRDVVSAGHVMLVETVAERIAEECLRNCRVRVVRVRVEKLDVWDDVGAVGVEIERQQPSCPPGVVDSQ